MSLEGPTFTVRPEVHDQVASGISDAGSEEG